jgi:hypothetical protein
MTKGEQGMLAPCDKGEGGATFASTSRSQTPTQPDAHIWLHGVNGLQAATTLSPPIGSTYNLALPWHTHLTNTTAHTTAPTTPPPTLQTALKRASRAQQHKSWWRAATTATVGNGRCPGLLHTYSTWSEGGAIVTASARRKSVATRVPCKRAQNVTEASAHQAVGRGHAGKEGKATSLWYQPSTTHCDVWATQRHALLPLDNSSTGAHNGRNMAPTGSHNTAQQPAKTPPPSGTSAQGFAHANNPSHTVHTTTSPPHTCPFTTNTHTHILNIIIKRRRCATEPQTQPQTQPRTQSPSSPVIQTNVGPGTHTSASRSTN